MITEHQSRFLLESASTIYGTVQQWHAFNACMHLASRLLFVVFFMDTFAKMKNQKKRKQFPVYFQLLNYGFLNHIVE